MVLLYYLPGSWDSLRSMVRELTIVRGEGVLFVAQV
jgi:hypothetical protein